MARVQDRAARVRLAIRAALDGEAHVASRFERGLLGTMTTLSDATLGALYDLLADLDNGRLAPGMRRTAYNQGYEAGCAEHPTGTGANPYDKTWNTDFHCAWLEGYRDGWG